MKKFIKICCITASAMLIVGFILTTISIALGAPAQLVAMANEGAFTIGDVNLAGDTYSSEWTSFNADYETYQGSMENMQIVPADEISSLDIDIAYGTLSIQPVDSTYIGIQSKQANSFQFYTENGTFYLKGFSKKIGAFQNDVTLYLPQEQYFDQINLSLGAGDVDITSLQASEITFDIGAGDFSCHNLTADMLSVELAAGSCNISNSAAQNAALNISMGEFNYAGTITKDLDLECSMGDVTMNLSDAYENHNYNLEQAMGTLNINGRSYQNFADDNVLENGADSTYDVECSMGTVSIFFKN